MTARATLRRFDTELSDALRQRGQRVTPQRLILHRVLRQADRHLTAEELLEGAGDRLPNISLPTVYATLELFEELGVVRRLSVGTGALLWDPRAADHHHLRCRRCGAVEDLEAPAGTDGVLAAARSAGFAADRAELTVVGLCRTCAGSGLTPPGHGPTRRGAPGPYLNSGR